MNLRFGIPLAFVAGIGLAAIYHFGFHSPSDSATDSTGSDTGLPIASRATGLGDELRKLSADSSSANTASLIERFPSLAYLTISADDLESLTALVIAGAPPKSINIKFSAEQCHRWLEHMKALPEWKDGAVRNNFLQTIAYSDPQLAISLSDTLGKEWSEDDGEFWKRMSYTAWSEQDPQAALIAAQEVADLGKNRERFLKAMAERWALADPLAYAAALQDGTIPKYDVGSNHHFNDAAAMVRAMSHLDLATQIATIKAVFGRYDHQFIRAAMMDRLTQDPQSVLGSELWTESGLDPKRYLRGMLGGRYRTMPFDQALQEFAGVRQAFGDEFADLSLVNITSSLNDTESFRRWRDAFPDEIGGRHLREFVNHNVDHIPSEELIALAADDPDFVKFALSTSILALAESDPTAAMRLLGDERLGNTQVSVTIDVANQLVTNAPEAAFEVLQANISDGEQLAVAQENVVSEWVIADAWGASMFVAELPAGRLRDYAAVKIAIDVYETEPMSALHWALQISDDEARYETLSNAPNAAISDQEFLDAVTNSTLEADERQRLLEYYRQRLPPADE